MSDCPHEPTNATASILEGVCPRCSERLTIDLDRRFGTCSCCGIGWRSTPEEVTLAIPIDGAKLVTSLRSISYGKGRLIVQRPLG